MYTSTILCNFALENLAENPSSYDRKIAIPYRAGTIPSSVVQPLEGNGTVSHQEAIEKAEREFEIYREREMRQLESDFDKAVKRLKNKINKDDKDES